VCIHGPLIGNKAVDPCFIDIQDDGQHALGPAMLFQ
jgi:hypothetical protein